MTRIEPGHVATMRAGRSEFLQWVDPVFHQATAVPTWRHTSNLAMVEYLWDTYGPKHGSEYGYQRHRRHGEAACEECRRAHVSYNHRDR